MGTTVEADKAIALAFTAYDSGVQAGRAEFVQPTLWEFKGHASRDTYFELKVVGRPTAKSLANILRQIELYHQFVAEDEAAEPPPANPSPSDMAAAGGLPPLSATDDPLNPIPFDQENSSSSVQIEPPIGLAHKAEG